MTDIVQTSITAYLISQLAEQENISTMLRSALLVEAESMIKAINSKNDAKRKSRVQPRKTRSKV